MPKAADKAVDPLELDTIPAQADFILSDFLAMALLKLGVPKALVDLISEVLPGEAKFDVRRALLRQFQTRVSAQEGRSGAELLARALVKQIDRHYEAPVDGVTLEERHAVVTQLAQNVSRQLILAADHILQYPEAALAVNVAKQKSDVRGLATARKDRTLLVEEVKQSLVNTVRAIVGDDTVG